MTEKEVEKVPEEQSMATYRKWFTCFSSNATTYMPEFVKVLFSLFFFFLNKMPKDMEKRRKAAETDVREKEQKKSDNES